MAKIATRPPDWQMPFTIRMFFSAAYFAVVLFPLLSFGITSWLVGAAAWATAPVLIYLVAIQTRPISIAGGIVLLVASVFAYRSVWITEQYDSALFTIPLLLCLTVAAFVVVDLLYMAVRRA